MEKIKQQLIKTLLVYGATNAKINKKQQMKLREWIIPHLMGELDFSGNGPMKIQDMRKFIDRWEADGLKKEDYEYYYVDKNSSGKSLWDLI